MIPTEEQIKTAARAIIVRKLAEMEIYPNEGTDVLDDVPESVKDSMLEIAEVALGSLG